MCYLCIGVSLDLGEMLRLRKRKQSSPVSDNADSEDTADDPATDKGDDDWQNKHPSNHRHHHMSFASYMIHHLKKLYLFRSEK